jgi:hypothetical protein
MAFLSTDDLSEVVIETLPGILEQNSALVAAGVRNISYNTDKISKINVPFPSIVAEGGVKPVENPEWELEDVKPIKLVQAMVVTEEFEDSEEGRRKAAEAIGAYLGSFAKGMDIAILNGTDPRSGNALGAYSTTNLKNNATPFNSADPTLFDRVLNSAIYGVDNADFVLLSDAGLSQYGQLISEPNGMPKYQNISRRAAFSLPQGYTAQAFTSVGLDSKEKKNTNLAYLGDFNRIGVSFQAPTVRIGREGTINGENLLAENKVAYIVEQLGRFYVDGPEKFAVVKNTATA